MSEMLAPPHGQLVFISIVQCIRLVNYQGSISTIKMGIYNLWILGNQSIKAITKIVTIQPKKVAYI